LELLCTRAWLSWEARALLLLYPTPCSRLRGSERFVIFVFSFFVRFVASFDWNWRASVLRKTIQRSYGLEKDTIPFNFGFNRCMVDIEERSNISPSLIQPKG
jgi:hypothetical protein